MTDKAIEVVVDRDEQSVALDATFAWRETGAPEHYGAEKEKERRQQYFIYFGLVGETTVHKAYGMPYDPREHVGNMSRRDFLGYQIRTKLRRNGKLQLREKDNLDDCFILVTLNNWDKDKVFEKIDGDARCYIEGWATGHEIKEQGSMWKPYDDRPAIIELDKRLLHPMEDLSGIPPLVNGIKREQLELFP